jgi:replicative DNA helicase
MSRRDEELSRRLDRLPPHTPEGEQGVLGSLLLAPEEGLSEVAGGRLQEEAFYDLRHRMIYRALLAMWDAKAGGIDLLTVHQWLKDRGQLEQIGGLGYLSGLADKVPSAANLEYYRDMVEDKWRRRRMLQALAQASARIYGEEAAPAAGLLDEIEASVLAANEDRPAEGRTMPDLVGEVGDLVENLHRGVGIIGGLRTRFSYFDKMTGGLHRKELIVIAARPSLGKTSWLLNMSVNIAKQGSAVAIFSMEMAAADLVLRMCCAEARINFHHMRTGFPSKQDVEAFRKVAPLVAKLPITIDDTPALGILELRARARRLHRQKAIAMVGVDYLQLMHGSKDWGPNRAMEVAEISGGLKGLAKELDVPVVALAQLNRELARQKNRKPQLEDLRESGSIEQDADLVALLYREKIEKTGDGPDDEEEEQELIPVNALIAKQRNGPTGDVRLIFNRPQMRMMDSRDKEGLEDYADQHAAAPQQQTVEGNKLDLPTSEELFPGDHKPEKGQE